MTKYQLTDSAHVDIDTHPQRNILQFIDLILVSLVWAPYSHKISKVFGSIYAVENIDKFSLESNRVLISLYSISVLDECQLYNQRKEKRGKTDCIYSCSYVLQEAPATWIGARSRPRSTKVVLDHLQLENVIGNVKRLIIYRRV
jgi:hypothetical protein